MNKLTAKQLSMINKKLSGDCADLSDETNKTLNDIALAPYEQNERHLYVYRDHVAKAAKLGCALLEKRPFKSKNSQTAVLALLTFLELNGIKLIGYENDLSELIVHLKNNDVERGCEWINNHRATNNIVNS